MGHDAVTLGPIHTAGRRRIESILAPNQQITRRRIATALLARVNTMDGPICYCSLRGLEEINDEKKRVSTDVNPCVEVVAVEFSPNLQVGH